MIEIGDWLLAGGILALGMLVGVSMATWLIHQRITKWVADALADGAYYAMWAEIDGPRITRVYYYGPSDKPVMAWEEFKSYIRGI